MRKQIIALLLLTVFLASATSGCGIPSEETIPSLGETWTRPTDKMVMVIVPAGEFEMGLNEKYSGAQPAHAVTLDSFWIDQNEVTNGQYRLCVEAGSCDPPARSSSSTRESYYDNEDCVDYPVIYVSWFQAVSYCEWAGGRLPTEAEWEYAARGPGSSVYPWGDDLPNDALLNYVNYVHDVHDTTEVSSYPSGASWCGALDMAGNVWEWVEDWYGDYPASRQVNPIGPSSGGLRVIRGGSWGSTLCFVRSAVRFRNPPDATNFNVGFRCVKGAEGTLQTCAAGGAR
ncbi:MAG: formylglycine-generating enzyme family protein [Chloroflexota bacterium]|nr:formylglycine-generating enzyme family protein [Chloroflexota bacterium]